MMPRVVNPPARRHDQGRQQQHQQYFPRAEDPSAHLPFFLGASARKRALELLYPEELDGPDFTWQGAHGHQRDGRAKHGRGAGKGEYHGPAPDFAEVKWLKLKKNSPLVDVGFNASAPVIIWSAGLQSSGLLNGVGALSQILVAGGDIEMHHDVEWSNFPEVCAALRQVQLVGMAYCLAICPSKFRWGVGVADKWKSRESAAKLALCVQLAHEEPVPPRQLPGFKEFCGRAGVKILGGSEGVPSLVDPQHGAVDAKNGLPRDAPVWIMMPKEALDEPWPEILKGMAPDTVAVATDGKRRGQVYAQADQALAMLTHESAESLRYSDDASWKEFPLVGKALLAAAEREECLMVGSFDLLNVWAVGVGMKRKNRERAAKLALATNLAIQAEDQGEYIDFSELEDFRQFVEEAKEARERFIREQGGM